MRVALLFAISCVLAFAYADNGCFPMTRAWGSGPGSMTRDQWWCPTQSLHGFLGFSYPVEDDQCSDYSYNGFLNDFKRMKHDYNASFVRTYLPVCTQSNFWVQMIRAARDANVGLVPMIFWGWDQEDSVMKKAESALLGALSNSAISKDVPYVVYAIAFGDELGEQGNYWLTPLKNFKAQIASYGIKISVTDDWDRSIYRQGGGGGGKLNNFGQQVNQLSDLTQAHVMPYYHADQAPDAFHMWNYYSTQLNYLARNNKQPIFISQTCWASYKSGDHQRGMDDWADNMSNYQQYWNSINGNCTLFKSLNIGWFFHSWNGEGAFDLINDSGKPIMNFKPNFC